MVTSAEPGAGRAAHALAHGAARNPFGDGAAPRAARARGRARVPLAARAGASPEP